MQQLALHFYSFVVVLKMLLKISVKVRVLRLANSSIFRQLMLSPMSSLGVLFLVLKFDLITDYSLLVRKDTPLKLIHIMF